LVVYRKSDGVKGSLEVNHFFGSIETE